MRPISKRCTSCLAFLAFVSSLDMAKAGDFKREERNKKEKECLYMDRLDKSVVWRMSFHSKVACYILLDLDTSEYSSVVLHSSVYCTYVDWL